MATPLLSLRGLYKVFDTQEALSGIDLDVMPGEFITLLGPSGCGKTTTLRIIAGLETPTSGSVFLEGQSIDGLPPEKRAVNTVFQNYALFPHMNVHSNIAYGLKMRKVPKKERDKKVEEMLSLIQLEGYGRRMPSQLSGGQRQRVAIARSAVLSPRLLLLDEPLGALDYQLRRQMQTELKRMQQQLGIAFIYITHDQEEALNMSDRIALMRAGRIIQLDTPRSLYEHPRTAFAATFIGATNLIPGTAAAVDGSRVMLDIGGITIPAQSEDWIVPGEKLCLCVRAERLHYGRRKPGCDCLTATFMGSHYGGGERTAMLKLPTGQTLISRHSTEQEEIVTEGETVCLWWDRGLSTLVKDDREARA